MQNICRHRTTSIGLLRAHRWGIEEYKLHRWCPSCDNAYRHCVVTSIGAMLLLLRLFVDVDMTDNTPRPPDLWLVKSYKEVPTSNRVRGRSVRGVLQTRCCDWQGSIPVDPQMPTATHHYTHQTQTTHITCNIMGSCGRRYALNIHYIYVNIYIHIYIYIGRMKYMFCGSATTSIVVAWRGARWRSETGWCCGFSFCIATSALFASPWRQFDKRLYCDGRSKFAWLQKSTPPTFRQLTRGHRLVQRTAQTVIWRSNR